MEGFFSFLDANRSGILVLLLSVLVLVLLVNWLAWIFSWGRYKSSGSVQSERKVQHLLGDLLVNIINDFRHLLALIIVLIFALVLVYAMVRAGTGSDNIAQALQSVVATMGAIIGSILGYYFGESAATRSLVPEPAPRPTGEVVMPVTPLEEIEPAPEPPPDMPPGEVVEG
jgi:hypothetical protein